MLSTYYHFHLKKISRFKINSQNNNNEFKNISIAFENGV